MICRRRQVDAEAEAGAGPASRRWIVTGPFDDGAGLLSADAGGILPAGAATPARRTGQLPPRVSPGCTRVGLLPVSTRPSARRRWLDFGFRWEFR